MGGPFRAHTEGGKETTFSQWDEDAGIQFGRMVLFANIYKYPIIVPRANW